jgi:hypothetical protein
MRGGVCGWSGPHGPCLASNIQSRGRGMFPGGRFRLALAPNALQPVQGGVHMGLSFPLHEGVLRCQGMWGPRSQSRSAPQCPHPMQGGGPHEPCSPFSEGNFVA